MIVWHLCFVQQLPLKQHLPPCLFLCLHLKILLFIYSISYIFITYFFCSFVLMIYILISHHFFPWYCYFFQSVYIFIVILSNNSHLVVGLVLFSSACPYYSLEGNIEVKFYLLGVLWCAKYFIHTAIMAYFYILTHDYVVNFTSCFDHPIIVLS